MIIECGVPTPPSLFLYEHFLSALEALRLSPVLELVGGGGQRHRQTPLF